VIDDQNVDRFLLSRILQSNGYLVETVSSCAEAYDQCRREQFDAITLDLVLPGLGWEVLARIRSLETYRNTPIVVISGCERADLEIPIDVESFLTKPVRSEHLLRELKRIGVPVRITKVANE
jgi:CheY-like chemotaxis protein